jgi:phosphatidate cytidylyltransferase
MGTRIAYGVLLTGLAFGMFYGDHVIGSPFPFLLVVSLLLGVIGSVEFVRMIPLPRRPRWTVVSVAAVLLLLSHWAALTAGQTPATPFHGILVFGLVIVLLICVEMSEFREPGEAVNRLGISTLIVVYLGVLPGFLIDIRLSQTDPLLGTLGLVLAVFVPKGCDIGAYFTGSLIGRHRMSPVLSPKKTWEGTAGGIATSVVVALAVQAYHPVIPGGWVGAAAFGVAVGALGLVGDLAESMIKRDCGVKDASRLIPGFGGVLDVIDSIIFAAPLVHLWLRVGRPLPPG